MVTYIKRFTGHDATLYAVQHNYGNWINITADEFYDLAAGDIREYHRESDGVNELLIFEVM